MLRAFHGLQAYPSRTKDPDGVDFSAGSVGLGAVAPNFASLADEYVRSHLSSDSGQGGRYISLLGDAELDEGSVWEAITEPELKDLSNVLWVVDLNRQSLDRIIPGIRVKAWREMFAANGWRYVDAKYGKRLQAAFAEPKGELLRQSIDDMSNEVYQRLLRVDPHHPAPVAAPHEPFPQGHGGVDRAMGRRRSSRACSETSGAMTSRCCVRPSTRSTWRQAQT